MINSILEKYKGCLEGLVIGDVLGAPFEFLPAKEVCKIILKDGLNIKDNNYAGRNLTSGFYTDDSAMTICLAESLLEKKFDLNDQFFKYRKWYLEGYASANGRCYGIGQQTLRALMKNNLEIKYGHNPSAGGNGSLMRSCPIALYYLGRYEEIKNKSILASRVTHENDDASWSCVVFNSIISLLIKGADRKEVLNMVLDIHNGYTPKNIKEILLIDYEKINSNNLSVSGFSLDTLRIAIWSLINADDFEDGITRVIMLGNDTDTFAAVTGALLGCYFGHESIPDRWKGKVVNFEYINKLAESLYLKSDIYK